MPILNDFLGSGTGRVENRMTNRDPSDCSKIEIGHNNEKTRGAGGI